MRHRSSILVFAAVAGLAGAVHAQSIPDGALVRYAGNPLLTKGPSGSYDQLKIGPRAILREAPNVWKMWYEAAPGGNQSTTAYATSTDGLTWTKYAGSITLIWCQTPRGTMNASPPRRTTPVSVPIASSSPSSSTTSIAQDVRGRQPCHGWSAFPRKTDTDRRRTA